MADRHANDILLWPERQVELLRRRATDELANEAGLDWTNTHRTGAAGSAVTHRRGWCPACASASTCPRLYWRGASRDAETLDGQPPLPLSANCEATLGELLADEA